MRANNLQPNGQRQEVNGQRHVRLGPEGGRGDLSEATTTNRGTERAKVHPLPPGQSEAGRGPEGRRATAGLVKLEGAVAQQKTDSIRRLT